MSFVCFTPYILGYIASFFNYFLLFQLLIRIVNCQLKHNIVHKHKQKNGLTICWSAHFMLQILINRPGAADVFGPGAGKENDCLSNLFHTGAYRHGYRL